jgi:hypothetical protein
MVHYTCSDYVLAPTVFYRWLKVVFENGAAGFQRQPDSSRQRDCSGVSRSAAS